MSNFKVKYTLKQHTPLIHFQHEQTGATLRATELKPELDRFLISQKGGWGNIPDKWKISGSGENHESLDYKVKIASVGKPQDGTVEIMPNNTESWVLHKEISLEIFSFQTDLLKEINQNINTFFVLHNFGKRQSKGFGCFYPKNLNEEDFVKIIKAIGCPIYKWRGTLQNEVQSDTDAYFYKKAILQNWMRLKSGQSYNGYEKSRVFEYLCDHSLRWDKRWIKRHLIDLIKKKQLPAPLQTRGNLPVDCNGQGWDDRGNSEYRFGRAMLGLAEHFGVTLLNVFTSGMSAKDIEESPKASLNVVRCPASTQQLVTFMNERFNTPYMYIPMPIGKDNTSDFLRGICNYFNLECDQLIDEQSKQVEAVYSQVRRHVEGKTVAVCVGASRTPFLVGFLSEMGLQVNLISYYRTWDGIDRKITDRYGTTIDVLGRVVDKCKIEADVLFYSSNDDLYNIFAENEFDLIFDARFNKRVIEGAIGTRFMESMNSVQPFMGYEGAKFTAVQIARTVSNNFNKKYCKYLK